MIVLHYTGMKSGSAALNWLCDPRSQVSCHYFLSEDGTTYQLVEDGRRAWHAGIASWKGEDDINSCSLGIEIVNPGHEHGYVAFSDAQISALLELLGVLVQKHKIPTYRILGHSDVAPTRKEDPGELFPWPLLAESGFGLWPDDVCTGKREEGTGDEVRAYDHAFRLLKEIGYCIPDDDTRTDDALKALEAFQRHFRPSLIDGVPDPDTLMLLEAVAAEVRRHSTI